MSEEPDRFAGKTLLYGKHCRGPGCDDFNESSPSCACKCSACRNPRSFDHPRQVFEGSCDIVTMIEDHYGLVLSDVAQTFIEDRVQRAIREGVIKTKNKWEKEQEEGQLAVMTEIVKSYYVIKGPIANDHLYINRHPYEQHWTTNRKNALTFPSRDKASSWLKGYNAFGSAGRVVRVVKKKAGMSSLGKLVRFARSVRDDWDCDSGANDTHADYCRCCEARKLLLELDPNDKPRLDW